MMIEEVEYRDRCLEISYGVHFEPRVSNGTFLPYPFGKRMPARHFVTDAEGNRYQYTGHEFDEETGYGYHGARYYNRELGRYMNVDRYAEKFYGQSPYVYAGDMPVMAVDVNGDSVFVYFDNSASNQALEILMKTKEGREYIGHFAAAGQVVAGHKFTKNGKYHKKGIDLMFEDNSEGVVTAENQGATYNGTDGPQRFGHPTGKVGDRFKIGVNLNSFVGQGIHGGLELKRSNLDKQYEANPEEHKRIWNDYVVGKVRTLTHELMIHTERSVQDYFDDGIINNSSTGGADDHDWWGGTFGRGNMTIYNNNGVKTLGLNKKDITTDFWVSGFKIMKKIHEDYKTGYSSREILNQLGHGLIAPLKY